MKKPKPGTAIQSSTGDAGKIRSRLRHAAEPSSAASRIRAAGTRTASGIEMSRPMVNASHNSEVRYAARTASASCRVTAYVYSQPPNVNSALT